jgi:PAS domain-containing protein
VSPTERKRAQRIERAPESAPEPSEERSPLVATDIMTENPRTIGVNVPIGDAAEVLESTEVRHLPVVSDEGDLVGMLSDRSNDAITMQALDGRILAWNRGAARMYGYSEQEALRMNIDTLVPEEGRAEARAFLESIKRGDEKSLRWR